MFFTICDGDCSRDLGRLSLYNPVNL